MQGNVGETVILLLHSTKIMNLKSGITNVLHSKKTAPQENHSLSLLPLSILLLLETHMEDTQSFTMDLSIPFSTNSDHMSFGKDRGHVYMDLSL